MRVVMVMSSLTFIRDPGNDWHFEKLGIQPDFKVPLNRTGEEEDETPRPFQTGEQATVFHVQEVMRLTLSQLRYDIQTTPPDDDGNHIVTTNKIQHRFNELSYSADSLWSNWGRAVEKAGGTTAGILQQILGVRIRERGRWIPHFDGETIACGEWHMLDDVRPTLQVLEEYGGEGVWINASTGLRLVRAACINQEHRMISLDHLLGVDQRFPSAEAWILWCLQNGTNEKPPQDQGTRYFLRLPDDEDAFQTLPSARDGPDGQWWTQEIDDANIPHFQIHDDTFVFGMLFKPPGHVDDNDNYWEQTYPYFVNTETGETTLVGPRELGMELQHTIDEQDLLEVGTDIVRKLRYHLHNELLRGLRIVVARQGLLNMPDINVTSLAKLGLSGSIIDTPFSDMFFLRPQSKSKPPGLVVGSPIEAVVKATIFRMNWYGA